MGPLCGGVNALSLITPATYRTAPQSQLMHCARSSQNGRRPRERSLLARLLDGALAEGPRRVTARRRGTVGGRGSLRRRHP